MMGGGTYRGAMTIEYNPSNGNGSGLVVDKHLAMRGQVQVKVVPRTLNLYLW